MGKVSQDKLAHTFWNFELWTLYLRCWYWYSTGCSEAHWEERFLQLLLQTFADWKRDHKCSNHSWCLCASHKDRVWRDRGIIFLAVSDNGFRTTFFWVDGLAVFTPGIGCHPWWVEPARYYLVEEPWPPECEESKWLQSDWCHPQFSPIQRNIQNGTQSHQTLGKE